MIDRTKSAFSSESPTSPRAISGSWLDRQLSPSLAATQRRLGTRAFAVASACVLASATGAAVLASFSAGNWAAVPGSNIVAATLAATASLVTASVFYQLLRQQHTCRVQAASAIAHNNIEWLALLGKLIELRDPETNGHNLRVALYTLMFAEALSMSPKEIVRATKGALLHDIGKLVAPDCILGKPGPLNPEERRVMEMHVQHGLNLVAQAEVLTDAIPVISAHHERYDGKGYKLGLQGEDIPYEARVFALIDVFDALTSRRVYKPALTVPEALAIMAEQRGAHFDPVLLDRFIELAPTLASRLPREEAALTSLLLQRLLPYIDFFTHMEPLLAGARYDFVAPSSAGWQLNENQ